MEAKTILVATDFSPCAEAALKHGTMLANSLGALLLIVNVELAPIVPGPYDDEDDPEEHRLHVKLEHTRPGKGSVAFQRHLLKGSPVEEIIKFADQRHADIIVMGTHGHTNAVDVPIGSVTQGVLERAKCALVAIRPAAAKALSKKRTQQTANT